MGFPAGRIGFSAGFGATFSSGFLASAFFGSGFFATGLATALCFSGFAGALVDFFADEGLCVAFNATRAFVLGAGLEALAGFFAGFATDVLLQYASTYTERSAFLFSPSN
jgi:hypothetical protein